MPMKDGFKTLISFANAVNMQNFAEVTVKPPGRDGRGPIDTTSMRNVSVTTKWPKQLVDVTDMTVSAQWEPAWFTDVSAQLLLRNQLITLTFPNAARLAWYGWLDKFEPQDHKEGEVPLANMTFVSSNINAGGAEATPFFL